MFWQVKVLYALAPYRGQLHTLVTLTWQQSLGTIDRRVDWYWWKICVSYPCHELYLRFPCCRVHNHCTTVGPMSSNITKLNTLCSMWCQFGWTDEWNVEDINKGKKNNNSDNNYKPSPKIALTRTITTVTTVIAMPSVQTLFASKMQGSFLPPGPAHNESTSLFHLIALFTVVLFDKSHKIRQPFESL